MRERIPRIRESSHVWSSPENTARAVKKEISVLKQVDEVKTLRKNSNLRVNQLNVQIK